jgi:hypothetical protein
MNSDSTQGDSASDSASADTAPAQPSSMAFPQRPVAFPNISTQPPPARSTFKKIMDELSGTKPAY